MQTKILSILALLLTVTQGAWAQVGRVLAADGKYYKTVTAATNAGTTASGMIVYWGDGDTSDNTYNQGLAIALSDVVNNGQWGAKQQDVTGITDTGRDATISMVDLRGIANTDAIVSKWPTGTYSYAADYCVSMSTARPSSSSNWFLPSQGQFVLMMNSYGAGYGTSTSYEYNNINKGAVVTAINNALTNAGGTALSNGRYWTSTEPDYKVAADWAADNSSFGLNDKTLEQNVRAMFAFSGATAAVYTVSYNANGGSGAPDAQTKDGGIDLTLSSTVPTRDGYTFAGWATSAEGAVAYNAGGSYTTNNDIVLYAQWTSTYTVALKSGTEDDSNWQGKAGTGDYQSLPLTGLEAGTAVNVKYNGTKMVKSVKAVKKAAKTDLLSGVFSVSASKKVNFSKGNLRYASSKWSFFDNQYDYYTSYSAGAWDKFGWSTSATTYGMNTSTDNATYSGDFVDWGATMGTGWFTLSSDEWTYLLNTRTASIVGGTTDGRYAKAKVNDVQGIILFPDTYTHPDGVTPPTGVNAEDVTGWNGNDYSSADWTKMESAGCVFLPAAGYRGQASVKGAGSYGYYWSSSPYISDAYRAYLAFFSSGTLNPASYSYRNVGYSVRLVQATSDAAAAARTLAEVTAGDIGKIVGKDGKIYATKADAEAVATGNAVAMIAYVGTASDCTHGLAIALADESGTKTYEDAGTACSGKEAVTGGTWRLPSIKDWQYMLIGCGASGSYSDNPNQMSCSELASKLNTAQGDALQTGHYWSSTEAGNEYVWTVYFGGEYAPFYNVWEGFEYRVRACLAFTVEQAAPAYTTLNNTMTAWTAGTYAVPAGGLTYSDAITVSGDVTLTLTDGETLTLNKGISLASGATLTIQGNGTMAVNGTNNSTASTVAGSTGTLILTSGTLTATGGNGGNGHGNFSHGGNGGDAINGSVIVSGGTLTASGGNGGSVNGDESSGGNGGDAISGSVIVSGGTLTARGGNGGSVNYSDFSTAGTGGDAINGTLTINGGSTSVNDGSNGSISNSDFCTAGTGGKGHN